MEDVTITSSLHGDRVFRCIGVEPYVRRDGSQTTLTKWQGMCVICGEPFEVKTPHTAKGADDSKSFLMTTCHAHRLTASERARLRFAKATERRDIWASIKASKEDVGLVTASLP